MALYFFKVFNFIQKVSSELFSVRYMIIVLYFEVLAMKPMKKRSRFIIAFIALGASLAIK